MRWHVIDLCGQRYGRLTVIRRLENDAAGRTVWLCRCDCGNTVAAKSSDMRRGHKRSCGCLLADTNRANKTKHGHAPKGNPSPEFKAWGSMKERCYSPKNISYPNYGARGITVCDRWLHGENGKSGFECFLDDMGPRPSSMHSIDRKDNNGNYDPGNCHWATTKQQTRNTRYNRPVTVDGETMPLCVACEKYGVGVPMVSMRLKRGWPEDRAVLTPRLSWGRKGGPL